MSSTTAAATTDTPRGANRLIVGIVLAVVTFWLFAQTTLNVAPVMREELRISESMNNLAVSITALFSGIFIVVAGGLADRVGRLKMTYFGLALSVLGSLLIALSPAGTAGVQKWGARRPMLLGCAITATGILLTTFTFLLARQYMIVAFVGFTLFGIGLGFYATPSTDAALSNVPNEKAGAASGIYKMASSLGAAFGVAISAALFTSLSGLNGAFGSLSDLFLGRTDNIAIRFAAAVALLFNVVMVIIAIVAIALTIPKETRA